MAVPSTLTWRKPSKCASGECAEVAFDGNMVYLRSSLNPNVVTPMTREHFEDLRKAFQAGEFNDW
jgi:hypothetical protein